MAVALVHPQYAYDGRLCIRRDKGAQTLRTDFGDTLVFLPFFLHFPFRLGLLLFCFGQ